MKLVFVSRMCPIAVGLSNGELGRRFVMVLRRKRS